MSDEKGIYERTAEAGVRIMRAMWSDSTAAAVEAERAACEEIAQTIAREHSGGPGAHLVGQYIADAIAARKAKP